MKNLRPITIGIFVLSLGLLLGLMWVPPATAKAQATVRNTTVLRDVTQVRDENCNPEDATQGRITEATPGHTPLFEFTGCNPLMAPDGHQLTLFEFKAVQGVAFNRCVDGGTETVVYFNGLVPGGTYTVWLGVGEAFFRPPPPFDAQGALGRTDPIENFFTANEDGEGVLSRTTPAGPLSALGEVGPCWLDAPAQLHLVYHNDGQTHGPVPGPRDTWVVIARFLFRF
ncbi:MAG TPA: hypothetical protein VKJ47_05320 [Candidatus Binatia bacterium]|nr:hypothetical protein [Candidatus Binatia bacterium]